MSGFTVTQHVVLVRLEPLVEQQVAGLEGVRQSGSRSPLGSLQLRPRPLRGQVVCSAVVILIIIIVVFITEASSFIVLKQSCRSQQRSGLRR